MGSKPTQLELMRKIKITGDSAIEIQSKLKYDFQKQIRKNLEEALGKHVWIQEDYLNTGRIMDNDSETKFYFEVKNNPFERSPRNRKIIGKI